MLPAKVCSCLIEHHLTFEWPFPSMMLSFNIGQEMGSNEYIQKQSGNFIKTHKKGVMLPSPKNIPILLFSPSITCLMCFFSCRCHLFFELWIEYGRTLFLKGGAQNNLRLKAVKKTNLQVLNQTKRVHESNIENELKKQLSFC